GLATRLRQWRPVGFYTTEIRERGFRRGFKLVSLTGERSILSHVDIPGPPRVGKYGVDIAGFETFLRLMGLPETGGQLVIIDEIGKMECFSLEFRRQVADLLDSEALLIATIALRGSGFIAQVKRRADCQLYQLTATNRDKLLAEIAESADRIFKSETT
ncbi:MAG: nucleoside-triphosphatase, partial [bacterium]